MSQRTLSDAQTLAAPFPALLADAQQLATTVIFGEHGRRKPGFGDAFWQFRPAQSGDGFKEIDWRKSARSDDAFVREAEAEIAQTVLFWCDPSASMGFSSSGETKAYRAQLLTLALAHVLLRGGERVGVTGGGLAARAGTTQLDRLHLFLSAPATQKDYGAPDTSSMLPRSQSVFLSDFLGPLDGVTRALSQAADRGVGGAICMILDPQEVDFPFKGRSIFQSMAGSLRYETQEAADLRTDYAQALEDRIATMRNLAKGAGWAFHLHRVDQSAQAALLWLYQALQQGHAT
ncbi:MAG: DUF58 domain-containing protein [Pseudomonadota bacterium]